MPTASLPARAPHYKYILWVEYVLIFAVMVHIVASIFYFDLEMWQIFDLYFFVARFGYLGLLWFAIFGMLPPNLYLIYFVSRFIPPTATTHLSQPAVKIVGQILIILVIPAIYFLIVTLAVDLDVSAILRQAQANAQNTKNVLKLIYFLQSIGILTWHVAAFVARNGLAIFISLSAILALTLVVHFLFARFVRARAKWIRTLPRFLRRYASAREIYVGIVIPMKWIIVRFSAVIVCLVMLANLNANRQTDEGQSVFSPGKLIIAKLAVDLDGVSGKDCTGEANNRPVIRYSPTMVLYAIEEKKDSGQWEFRPAPC